MPSKHTYPFGIIGNCSYLAHINNRADIKWLCWPRFDSPFIFGSLVDEQQGGHFSIQPAVEGYKSRNYYLENTNVLITEFEKGEDRFRVIDFAPRFRQYDRYFKPLMLIRKIEYISGTPLIKISCKPVTGYSAVPCGIHEGSNHIQYTGLPEELRLTTDIPLAFIRNESSFLLYSTQYIALTYGLPLEANLPHTAEEFLNKTVKYWRDWVKSTYLPSVYQHLLIRSALALKIHQYEQTGGIIAAGTTSLPEINGHGRNWDYRYCWLRDTYYILTAFNNIGHFEELEKYFQYVANISVLHTQRLQPLYSVEGQPSIIEQELKLQGYLGNKPVRIGNAAYEHIQNDVYGQVLVSLLPLYTDLRLNIEERAGSQELIGRMLHMINSTMHEPDAGLWEFRNFRQLHGYTFLFHWAGSCAAEKVLKYLNPSSGDINFAQGLRSEAASQIEKCFDPSRGVYTQAVGTKDLDFSMVQLITLGYLNGNSTVAASHLKTLEDELSAGNGLFYRYLHKDDFGKPETAFLICSFWHVEALVMTGRVKEAIDEFEQLMGYANHLGLFSEDVSPSDGSQWGNFPQAYSHVGLINAAFRIARRLDQPNYL